MRTTCSVASMGAWEQRAIRGVVAGAGADGPGALALVNGGVKMYRRGGVKMYCGLGGSLSP